MPMRRRRGRASCSASCRPRSPPAPGSRPRAEGRCGRRRCRCRPAPGAASARTGRPECSPTPSTEALSWSVRWRASGRTIVVQCGPCRDRPSRSAARQGSASRVRAVARKRPGAVPRRAAPPALRSRGPRVVGCHRWQLADTASGLSRFAPPVRAVTPAAAPGDVTCPSGKQGVAATARSAAARRQRKTRSPNTPARASSDQQGTRRPGRTLPAPHATPSPRTLADSPGVAGAASCSARFGGGRGRGEEGRHRPRHGRRSGGRGARPRAAGEAFPGAAVLAEEGGASAGTGALRFIVDPLDGTTNYARGVPHFSVTSRPRTRTGSLAGVVFDPMRDELYGRCGAAARPATAAAAGEPRRGARRRGARDGAPLRRARPARTTCSGFRPRSSLARARCVASGRRRSTSRGPRRAGSTATGNGPQALGLRGRGAARARGGRLALRLSRGGRWSRAAASASPATDLSCARWWALTNDNLKAASAPGSPLRRGAAGTGSWVRSLCSSGGRSLEAPKSRPPRRARCRPC